MEDKNEYYEQAIRLAEHMDELEFRTVAACDFRSRLRRWYYGSRSDFQAWHLIKDYKRLFSDNFLLDYLEAPVWEMAEEFPEGEKLLRETQSDSWNDGSSAVHLPGKQWREKVSQLKELPLSHIRGKTLEYYLRDKGDSRADQDKYLRQVGSKAARTLEGAYKDLSKLYSMKWVRYRDAGVSLLNMLLSVLVIAALCFAVPALFYLVVRLRLDGVANLPLTGLLGNKIVWGVVAVWIVSIAAALFRLPRYLMCVAGNLVWFRFMKKEFRQDKFLLDRMDQAYSKEIEAYIQELQTALQQGGSNSDQKQACLQKPLQPAVTERLMPGVDKLRRKRRWELAPFQDALDDHRFLTRRGTVCLFLLVFVLGQLLMMDSGTFLSLLALLP